MKKFASFIFIAIMSFMCLIGCANESSYVSPTPTPMSSPSDSNYESLSDDEINIINQLVETHWYGEMTVEDENVEYYYTTYEITFSNSQNCNVIFTQVNGSGSKFYDSFKYEYTISEVDDTFHLILLNEVSGQDVRAYPNDFIIDIENSKLGLHITDTGNDEDWNLVLEQSEKTKKNDSSFNTKQLTNYSTSYPTVGMSEEDINKTILGPADNVEKCRDFEHLVPRARSKTYSWGTPNTPEYFQATVWYRRYWRNRFDDYTEYQDGHGYVYSIFYTGEDGYVHTEDLSDHTT